jgi:hypothetical protein
MITFPIEFNEFLPGTMRVIIADSVLIGLKYWSKQIDEPLEDFIEEQKRSASQGVAYQIYLEGECYQSIIITRETSLTTLIHETLHSAFQLLDHYDVYFDKKNHEILCRTQAEILNKIFPELKKRKIELK